MHWISLIAFIIIINICRSEPTVFKSFETGNTNKGGTFQAASNGNNAAMFESKNNVDGSVPAYTNNAPPKSSMNYDKDGKNSVKFLINSGNNNYCSIILPIIIAGFVSIIHF